MDSRTKTEQTERQHRLEVSPPVREPSPSQLRSLALLREERTRQREAESQRPESVSVAEYDPGDVEGSEVVAWMRDVS